MVLDGLAFPEGPRWHQGALWFSDMFDEKVCQLSPSGEVSVVLTIDQLPSGLGWLPGGDLLVVSMLDRRVLRWNGTALSEWASLLAYAEYHLNDMIVGQDGTAYVGNFGHDGFIGRPVAPSTLVMVDGQGRPTAVARDLLVPNGMAITPDGRTLLVAETSRSCLTAFDIHHDGTLGRRRVWAQFSGEIRPGDVSLDARGNAWVCCGGNAALLEVREGGEILSRLDLGPVRPAAGTFGGDDGKTYYLATFSDSYLPQVALVARSGAIRALRSTVPGAGFA